MKNIAITENHLYSKAYAKGAKFSGRLVAVYVLRDFAAKRLMRENPMKKYVNRVGISVSKKYGMATERVRAKRIVRAALSNIQRDETVSLKTGFLVVIAIREGCHGAKSTDVEKELRYGLAKLDMLTKVNDGKPTDADSTAK